MTALTDLRSPKPLLDWLRFGAALMVVLGHCRKVSFLDYPQLDPVVRGEWLTKIVFATTRYGIEAVVAFFILSGYLVGGASIRKLKQGTFDIGGYASDRISRIMLPLVPAVLFTAGLHLAFGPPVGLGQVLGNLLSLQGQLIPTLSLDSSLWSLSFEVWCYVFNGALMLLLSGRARILAATILALALVQFSHLDPNYLIVWYVGALIFLIDDGRSSLWGLAIALAITGLGILLWQTAGRGWQVQALFMVAIGFAALVRQLASWPVVSNRWMEFGGRLAAFSYSLYLIHYPVLQLVDHALPSHQQLNGQSLALFSLRVAICLAAGWIFYLCFELHTPRVRRWLRTVFCKDSLAVPSVTAFESPAPLE